ncbi:MAG TPA: BatA and WFA domain-containing protein, partial [Longimicrobiales bacterium]|nr:BatA and WFA domain-containing protein [Longimicrobiales bacterium]
MMGFLSPLWLALGAAIAVPIVLHLYHRHQGPRVVFPALRYLRRAEREHARRIRLRQLLLLALRISAVVLIALTVARPFVRSETGVHQPTAVAIVIDNSLGSGLVVDDRRVLDMLKDRALETLAAAGPDDRFWLIQAGAPWQPAAPGDAAATIERVLRLEPTAAVADIGMAVTRAQTLLAAGADGRAREVHVLTDLSRVALNADAAPDIADPAPVLVWHPGGAQPVNTGVASVQVAGGLPPRAGERASVHVQLEHTGEPGDSVTVRLMIDGRIQAADRAARDGSATLSLPPLPTGVASGWVEIDADALRGDDRRYFVVRVQPPPRVAAPRSLPFVSDALDVLADGGRIEWVGTAEAEIVIAPSADDATALSTGRAIVVLPPESPLELPAVNQRLAMAGIPWRYELPRPGGEARLQAPDGDPELGRAITDVRVLVHYPLVPAGADSAAPPESSVLLQLTDGSPWAVQGSVSGGSRYVLLGSPLVPAATTLPTSTAMVPLLDRVLGPWAAAQPPRTEFQPGETLAIPAGAEYVERPDERRDPVSGSAMYGATEQAGIYEVIAGDEITAAFAVNPPPEASRLERADAEHLRAALGEAQVLVTSDPGDWARLIFRQRHGREIWRLLAILVLAVLLVEGFVAATGRARARQTGDATRARTDGFARG